MPLADKVGVGRAFLRAVRVDADIGDPESLRGFICPPSSASALRYMARHISDTGQAAFTWTGPYGAGKSSLAVALASALSGDAEDRKSADAALGKETADAIRRAMPPKSKGWRVLPIVGSRIYPARAVGGGIAKARWKRVAQNAEWSEEDALDALDAISRRDPGKRGGLLVIIDEMGKFLEAAAYEGADLHFFQQLAELASRSGGRLAVVGILHQSFEEYSNRLSREMRDEWAKIQGRFIDMSIDASPDETLALLSRAIEFDAPSRDIARLAKDVSDLTGGRANSDTLAECWPLHPITASLLGPISRRSFGQNQRSLFGFLNSSEPEGFRDFLRDAEEVDLYSPSRLWEYLRANLEQSIMASPDGHRWTLAVGCMERCRDKGGDDPHIRLLQSLTLLDMFENRSGVAASEHALRLSLSDDFDKSEIDSALSDLQNWSIIMRRRFSGSYGLYEGSDFDIEAALDRERANLVSVPIDLTGFGDLKPVFAKRHYHEFGALRWYDLMAVSILNAESAIGDCLSGTKLRRGAAGAFVLSIPEGGGLDQVAQESAFESLKRASSKPAGLDIALGIPARSSRALVSLIRERQALTLVLENSPELLGDRVARDEIRSRITAAEERIELELDSALDSAVWHFDYGETRRRLRLSELSSAASDVADKRFSESPRVFSELLNRIAPSSSAASGRNALMRRMVSHEGQARLGIEGYPAEGGLFDTLLGKTNLYQENGGTWSFVDSENVGNGFQHIWRAGKKLLQENSNRAVDVNEICDLWRQPPYGVKDGVLPVFALAFLLSNKRSVAFYRDDVFQTELGEIDVEVLAKTPQHISARWMGEYRVKHAEIWRSVTEVARDVSPARLDSSAEPLEVARALVAAYDALPKWTERAGGVSENAKQVRRILKNARDPNKVIFDDIAALSGSHGETPASLLRDAMKELQGAYPDMLDRLRRSTLRELGIDDVSKETIEYLRVRSENIRGLCGDHRMESFIMRMSNFDISDFTMESLASLSLNKPPSLWTDSDADRALVELAKMAREFVDLETLAHVNGGIDLRDSMSVAARVNGTAAGARFNIAESERGEVERLVKALNETVESANEAGGNVVLAALAELSVWYINANEEREK